MTETMYHRLLRMSSLALALLLLFDSGLLSPVTRELSQNTQHYLAQSIGMYASVEPTEINQLTARLTERDRDLDAREAALKDRELSIGLMDSNPSSQSTFILSVLLFLLLVLIVLNYIFDFLRSRPRLT